MSKRKNSSQQRQEKFGEYLRGLVKQRWHWQKEAADELGISEEILSRIINGKNFAPDKLLIILSEKCNVPLEEILRRKYWPQLFLLTGIIEPTELTTDLVDELNDVELEELTRYAAFLLLRRHVAMQYQHS